MRFSRPSHTVREVGGLRFGTVRQATELSYLEGMRLSFISIYGPCHNMTAAAILDTVRELSSEGTAPTDYDAIDPAQPLPCRLCTRARISLATTAPDESLDHPMQLLRLRTVGEDELCLVCDKERDEEPWSEVELSRSPVLRAEAYRQHSNADPQNLLLRHDSQTIATATAKASRDGRFTELTLRFTDGYALRILPLGGQIVLEALTPAGDVMQLSFAEMRDGLCNEEDIRTEHCLHYTAKSPAVLFNDSGFSKIHFSMLLIFPRDITVTLPWDDPAFYGPLELCWFACTGERLDEYDIGEISYESWMHTLELLESLCKQTGRRLHEQIDASAIEYHRQIPAYGAYRKYHRILYRSIRKYRRIHLATVEDLRHVTAATMQPTDILRYEGM